MTKSKITKIALGGLLISALTACGEKTSAEHIEAANQAIAKQDYKSAVIELKNAVKQSPEQAEYRFLLGKTYLELRQFTFAEKELERALDYGYDAKLVVPLLAQTYQKNGTNKSLFKLTSKAKGLKPSELAQLKLYQIEAYVGAGNQQKAEALIDELKGIKGGGAYAKLAFVYDLILKQQFDAAIEQLDSVLSRYKNHPDALKMKANLQIRNQQFADAVETYVAYVDAFPEEDEVKFLITQLYKELNQMDKAAPYAEELLKKYPGQPELLEIKATLYAKNNDYQQALKVAEQAILQRPESTSLRLVAGLSAYMLNQHETAVSHFSLVASLLPPEHIGLRMLADSQLKLGKTLEANDTVSLFNSISEQDSNLLSGLGQALVQQGEINKAKDVLNKQPEQLNSAEALASLARLKLSLNDKSGIIDLEKALDLSKDSLPEVAKDNAQSVLAQAYLSSKQYDKALAIAKAWQREANDYVKGITLEAKVLALQGKAQQASALLNEAHKKAPDSVFIAFQKIGQMPIKTEAEQQKVLSQLTHLLEKHPDFLPAISTHYTLSKMLKQPESMTNHLEKLQRQMPDNQKVAVILGQLYYAEGKHDQAIRVFEKVMTESPNLTVFWDTLAKAYVKSGQGDKAKLLYQQWFEKEPNNAKAIKGIVSLFDITGETQKALAVTQAYLNDAGGQSLDVKLLNAYLLAKSGNPSEANQALTLIPERLLELPIVHTTKGLIALQQGDFSTAQSQLTAAYETTPGPQVTSWLVNAIVRASGMDQAIRFLQSHLKSHPNDQLNLFLYAQMQTGNDNKQAIEYYQKAVTYNPSNFIAQNNLAYLYSEQGQYEKALVHAKSALKIKPNDGRVLDTVGMIELKLGNKSDALKHLSRAITDESIQGDDIFINYIEVLYANNEVKLAERKLETHQFSSAGAAKKIEALKAKYL